MDTLLARLGLALTIGLLVGLERGWRERDAPAHSRTAGIRTYGIAGLLGGIFAALAQSLGAVSVLIAGFLGFAATFTFYNLREAAMDEDFSVTGVIAGFAVFALGALAVAGNYQAAAGLGRPLRRARQPRGPAQPAEAADLGGAALRPHLSVMTAVILPLLPNRPIDPWGGLNPWEIWVLHRADGRDLLSRLHRGAPAGSTRGLLVSALGGALISSTAATLALARTAKSQADPYPLAGAAALAAVVSIARVGLIAGVVEPRALAVMAPAARAAALGFGLCGAVLLFRQPASAAIDPPARSPFELGPLLVFALLFAVVATANAALARHVGAQGIVATSAISGAIDVDVAVLSALRLVGTSATATAAGEAALAAISVNSLLRLALAIASAPPRFWIPLLFATAVAAILGGLAFFLIPAL